MCVCGVVVCRCVCVCVCVCKKDGSGVTEAFNEGYLLASIISRTLSSQFFFLFLVVDQKL